MLILWTLPWKGVALWRAAEKKQKNWFIVLFVLNTAALLEIAYIFYFSGSKKGKKRSSSSPKSRQTSETKSENPNDGTD